MSVALNDLSHDKYNAEAFPDNLKDSYHQVLMLIERLHRMLLDVIKDGLDRNGCDEINSVQALLIYNIGESELTAGELRTRGHYLGSNVSYNLKKLVDAGYILHERSSKDRRLVWVRLSDAGRDMAALVNGLFEKQLGSLEKIGGVSAGELNGANTTLQNLERFWTDQIRYRL